MMKSNPVDGCNASFPSIGDQIQSSWLEIYINLANFSRNTWQSAWTSRCWSSSLPSLLLQAFPAVLRRIVIFMTLVDNNNNNNSDQILSSCNLTISNFTTFGDLHQIIQQSQIRLLTSPLVDCQIWNDFAPMDCRWSKHTPCRPRVGQVDTRQC